jgi:hypothetical protein
VGWYCFISERHFVNHGFQQLFTYEELKLQKKTEGKMCKCLEVILGNRIYVQFVKACSEVPWALTNKQFVLAGSEGRGRKAD